MDEKPLDEPQPDVEVTVVTLVFETSEPERLLPVLSKYVVVSRGQMEITYEDRPQNISLRFQRVGGFTGLRQLLIATRRSSARIARTASG